MTQQNKQHIEEDEIDLIALAKTLWEGRRTVIKTTLIFMAIGLFVAIFSEKEYTASTTFVPQTSDSKIGGNLGGLAAMAGINLGSIGGSSDVLPISYPHILKSITFQKTLLNTHINIEGQETEITFRDYYQKVYTHGILVYLKKYTIGLPRLIINSFKNESKKITLESSSEDLPYISDKELKLIEILENQITLNFNEDEGFLELSVKMPEALAAAQLTKKIQSLLQEYIINFKIQKSKEQLDFIKSRYFEVEKKFKIVQQKLANNRDRNQNITTAMAKTPTEMLQDEYNLIYDVYLELAKQLEAQYIQVTEDTPVFTIIKPVFVPIEKSKPKRVFILVLWTFLGFVSGIGIVYGKDSFLAIKKKWNEK